MLHALEHGMRPDPATLTRAARANVVAHLCSAGRATEGEQDRLAALQPSPGDPQLADAIDADRQVAGVPPVQRTALAAQQGVLADGHAAALVTACLDNPDPAGRLATLVRAAPAGTPAAFMRRVAAAWARQSAGRLAQIEEAASAAASTALTTPAAQTTARLVATVNDWAALTAPQRASDARAGLDHAPALRVVRDWRNIGVQLTGKGHPELALALAQAIGGALADLPGESAQLQSDIRDCAGRVEEHGLQLTLTPLRALVERLAADLAPLQTDLSRTPFGPGAPGTAGELWAAFNAATAACRQSEAPWTLLRQLLDRLGGAHKPGGVAAALTLLRGMAARAATAGFADLAARLQTDERSLESAAALWRYREAADQAKKPWQGGIRGRRRTLGALRAALSVVTDPASLAALRADEQALLRRGRAAARGWAMLAAVAGGAVLVTQLDRSYSENAPYRHAAPQSLAGSGPAIPETRPDPAPAPLPVMPPPVPTMPQVPDPRMGAPTPKAPLAFPTRTAVPERRPQLDTSRARTLPEVRWCEFNKIRLQAAIAAASDEAGLSALEDEWSALCTTYPNYRRDEERVATEAERFRSRLQTEGRAMLSGPQP